MESQQDSAPAAEMHKNQNQFLRHMESLGLVVRLPPPAGVVPPGPFERIVVAGEPLSQSIVKDRR